MVHWYFPTTFRCDLHQVDGGTFPFDRYCKHCLEEQLWLAFDAASGSLGFGVAEQAVLFDKALRLAIFNLRLDVRRGEKRVRPEDRDSLMQYLKSDGDHLIVILMRILCHLPREER